MSATRDMSATDDGHTLQTAHSLRRSGRLSEAAGLYRQLVSKDSDNFHALHFLGVTEAETGNFKQAKRLMARSLSIQPPNIQFVENYATILFQAGDYKSALDFADRSSIQRQQHHTIVRERAGIVQTR